MSSRKSTSQNSLITLQNLEKTKIQDLFSVADAISRGEKVKQYQGLTGALLFFEASTRTRMSFETAAARLGVHPLSLEGISGTSLEKGESLEDTVLNVAAMKPAFLVIRSGDALDFNVLQTQVPMPILNAGWGKVGHPTQALLDAYTISKHQGALSSQRLLIVGDVVHSRVAASHFELAQTLGYEIALCGPDSFLPANFKGKVFSNLQEGLAWCTVVMALRVQLERHQEKHSLSSYNSSFGLTKKNLIALGQNCLIMHPGPINHGVEFDSEVLQDPRCVVLEQVTNGVLIRQALLQSLLEEGNL
jgi:aspartate carbamoyltransferase catalytic subunit